MLYPARARELNALNVNGPITSCTSSHPQPLRNPKPILVPLHPESNDHHITPLDRPPTYVPLEPYRSFRGYIEDQFTLIHPPLSWIRVLLFPDGSAITPFLHARTKNERSSLKQGSRRGIRMNDGVVPLEPSAPLLHAPTPFKVHPHPSLLL